MSTINEDVKRKIINMIGLAVSDHAGESAAAVAGIKRVLAANKLTIGDLKATLSADPAELKAAEDRGFEMAKKYFEDWAKGEIAHAERRGYELAKKELNAASSSYRDFIVRMVHECLKNEGVMLDNEKRFLRQISVYFSAREDFKMSEKQSAWFGAICEKYGALKAA